MMRLILIASVALLVWTGSAQALTLGVGDVIANGKVTHVTESEVTKRIVDRDGFHISGGVLVLAGIDGGFVTVPLHDLAGKSRDGVMEVVEDAVVADAVVEHLKQEVAREVAREVTENVAERVAERVEDFVFQKWKKDWQRDIEWQKPLKEAIEAGRIAKICSGAGCERWAHEVGLNADERVEWKKHL